ncbi:hypothetical protein PR048_015559 [Dryococelus australis]|uniref:Uncharacterized protein n=1 Tax=Dryococelus australis TaxID=614101 RepID=A0ABQ9HHK6_9NEOP|nr:hypothetical protein PR048_015559 [Dryococelus australis]
MKFLSNLGQEHNVIQYPELNHVCLLLGAFHSVMNLLDTIGSIMSASGEQEILELIYAEKTVSHILSGKAYSRAVHAHLMIDYFLNALLLEKKLITADSTGSFPLHIEGISASLLVFASTGHFNYTMAAYLHLQNMIKLEKTHPDIFVKFMKRGHVVRRKEKKWSGIAADLLIELSLLGQSASDFVYFFQNKRRLSGCQQEKKRV